MNSSPAPTFVGRVGPRGARETSASNLTQGTALLMVNRNLLRQFDLPEDELNQELAAAFNQPQYDENYYWLQGEDSKEFNVNKIVEGKVLNIVGDDVVIDVGYKSEGVIPLEEWKDEGLDQVQPPKV